VLSWVIAILLALPLGIIVGNISGKAFPLDPAFSLRCIILCLAIVLVFSAIASFYPAWKASVHCICSDDLMQDCPDQSGMYDEKSYCAGRCWMMREYDLHCVRDYEYCFTIFCIRAIVSSYL
jgi:hypothetical protein